MGQIIHFQNDALYTEAFDAREARGLPREPTKEEQEQWWMLDKERAILEGSDGGGVLDSTTVVTPRDPRTNSASSADPDGSISIAAAALGIANTDYYDLPKHLRYNADDWFNVGMSHLFPENGLKLGKKEGGE